MTSTTAAITMHDVRMAQGLDACNSATHDHSRQLTDSEVEQVSAGNWPVRGDGEPEPCGVDGCDCHLHA